MKLRLMFVLLLTSLWILAYPQAIRCLEKEKAAPEATHNKSDQSAREEGADGVPMRKIPQLEPGTWEPIFEVGDSIYPSVAISTATLKIGLWAENDKQHLGDPWGIIGMAIRGTKDNCAVEVEIWGESFIKPSTFTGELAQKDIIYCIYPNLKYDYEKLLKVKQTVPETLSFKVKIGEKTYPVKTVRLQVRPVNECVFSFIDSSGALTDTSYLFAAYVNENHPFINQILKEAIQSGKVDNFEGYSSDADNSESIMAEIEAVWKALQDRGIRYSAMPASADDDNPYIDSQYVRLLGESINYTQANCVDGSVLMASIFRKIGLNVSLIEVPEHMFIGVALDPEGKKEIYIETTDLGQASFSDALRDGKQKYDEANGKFDSNKEDDRAYNIVNIQDARRMGIMPIKDSSAKQIAEKGDHPTRVAEEDDDE